MVWFIKFDYKIGDSISYKWVKSELVNLEIGKWIDGSDDRAITIL